MTTGEVLLWTKLILRFTEQEVVVNLQAVADQIEMWIQNETTRQPTPGPSKGGEQTE